MNKLSEFAERTSVSEVAAPPSFNERERARSLVADIAGHCWNGRGDMVDRVFEAIRRHFPKAAWTRRRVRAFWHRESAVVRWREMRELEYVAEIERTRRLQKEQEKAAHNEFLQHIGATIDRLEASDADFYREHREALRSLAIQQAHSPLGSLASESGEAAPVGGENFSVKS